MKRALQFIGVGTRHCLSVVGSFVLWSVWLALALVLAVQAYILSSSQLEVPQFALRELEARLAQSGIIAKGGRALFDPKGRVLLENVKLSLPAYPDPVLTARAVYVQLDPWWLIVGRVELKEIHVIDAAIAVPAMLSPTGQPVEVVSRLYGTFIPAGKTIYLQQLSGQVAGVFVTANGSIIPPKPKDGGPPFEQFLGDFVRNRFVTVCKQALDVAARARQFEQPELHLDFAPSGSGAASASILFLARSAELTQPVAARVTDLRARTRVLLFGDKPPSWLEFSAAEVDVPGIANIRTLQGEVYGRFQPGPYVFEPREITLSASSVHAAGFVVDAISTQIQPRPLPKLDVSLVARINHAPLGVEAKTDIERKDARVSFRGEIDPHLLVILSDRLKVNIRRFFDFERLFVDRGEAAFDGGWKFQKLDAHLRLDGVNAYGVRMTDGRVVAELTPQRFYSPDASARVGENFARGTYEHDLRTQDYRFLLDGRLRPMELNPWFKEWWSDFFQQLDFSTAPPVASVDVQSRWLGGSSSVFVFADAERPIIRGTPLERVRTRLFIRPGFFDGLELFLTQADGFGNGRFTLFVQPEEQRHSVDLAMRSSLDLKTISSLLGPEASSVLDTFEVAKAPDLGVTGRFTMDQDRAGSHQELRVEARTSGAFRFRNFPMTDASFVATWRDDDISIDDFEALVAGGVALGHARIWGRGEDRRLGFDVTLNEATLGQAASTGADFIARQKGVAPEPPGKFVQEKANVRLVLTASAEGSYDNPYSYRGNGSASISGTEIAEIPLLGALSEVLKFTSLRFTEAQTSFKIEGPRVVFPDVKVRGPDGAIDGQGTYVLEKRGLDFQAKISPFQESEGLIKTVVGVVLTPITSAFEVKLTGTLDNPNWSVTLNPGNIIRSITPGDSIKTSPSPEPVAPTTPSPPKPKGP